MKIQTRHGQMTRGAWLLLALLTASAPLVAWAQADTANIDISQGCNTGECHGEVTSHDILHGPLNLGECTPCHAPQDGRHVFASKGEASCELCHMSEQTKEFQHAPFEGSCTLCHDPHGGDNRYFVTGGTGAEGCNLCHSDVTEGLKMAHGPVALGECLVCHSPHQSDHEGLLVEARPQLCQSCHVDVAQSLEGAASVHTVVGQECAGCHNAHGGERQYFLVAEGQDLCASCHEDFLGGTSDFKFPHQPMTEGKGCNNCHEAHASTQAQLLKGQNQELCLDCHNEPIETATRTLNDVETQIEEAGFLHGPLREQNCIACHQAHGSDFANILEKAFPASFYAEYEQGAYNLCFDCHDGRIVEEKRGDITEFRNGDRNLHFVHVNQEKGRSCRACHHEHASSQPHHVRSEVPFGRWVMDVRFEKTDTGGGCTTGCHLPYRYDREEPVDYDEGA